LEIEVKIIGTIVTGVLVLAFMSFCYWSSVDSRITQMVNEGACPIEAKYALNTGLEGERALIREHVCNH
jgi:hypothetical protein